LGLVRVQFSSYDSEEVIGADRDPGWDPNNAPTRRAEPFVARRIIDFNRFLIVKTAIYFNHQTVRANGKIDG